MNKTLHVWPEPPSRSGGYLRLEAKLEIPGAESETLWFQVPEAYETEITQDHDPFILATLMLAMERADKIHVHGSLSPSLLKNLEEFQQVWHCWLPNRYHLVEMLADTECESKPPPAPREVICAFSGGVDSAFTAWRHAKGLCGRRREPLTAGLLVQGFVDIPLDKPHEFAIALDGAKQMLQSIGLETRTVATNFTSLDMDWEYSHVTGAAACLHLFEGRFAAGLLGSGEPYQKFPIPWGSNPISDPLLSSETFPLITDGLAFTREEKMRTIVDWPEALAYLRVCWQVPGFDRNCGHCEKCIRTKLLFMGLGIENPACLPEPISDDEIRNLSGLNAPQLVEMELIYNSFKAGRASESWMIALKECIEKNQPVTPSPLEAIRSRARNRLKWYLKSASNRMKSIGGR